MEPQIRITPFFPELNSALRSFEKANNPAQWTHDRLRKLINDFEENLDAEHEIGLRLVSFGNGSVFHVIDLGYWGPDIIIFNCLAQDGSRADLVQHISQLNVLFQAVPKIGESPRRIGFDTSSK